MSKKHKKQSSKDKWTKITARPKPNKPSRDAIEKHNKRKRKKRHNKLGKLNKIGKGVIKRTDSIGKFTGGIIKKQSDAISNITNTLANPLVMIAIGGVVLFIILKK